MVERVSAASITPLNIEEPATTLIVRKLDFEVSGACA
jgi:hypothetical protein